MYPTHYNYCPCCGKKLDAHREVPDLLDRTYRPWTSPAFPEPITYPTTNQWPNRDTIIY